MATADPMMPDLSHLSAEERAIIEQVLARQRAEEQKEEEVAQQADRELGDIERQINERKENAQRLVGTQDDAICQICQKTKFADGIGHKCFYCQLRSCARCGGRTTSKSKNIWACSLCQKRQQILARTGKWFQNAPLSEQPESMQQDENSCPSTSTTTTTQFQQNYNTQPTTGQTPLTPLQQAPQVEDGERRLSAGRRQNTLQRQPSLEKTDSQLRISGTAGGIHSSASAAATLVHTATSPDSPSANGRVQRGRGRGSSTAVQRPQATAQEAARRISPTTSTTDMRPDLSPQLANGGVRRESREHQNAPLLSTLEARIPTGGVEGPKTTQQRRPSMGTQPGGAVQESESLRFESSPRLRAQPAAVPAVPVDATVEGTSPPQLRQELVVADRAPPQARKHKHHPVSTRRAPPPTSSLSTSEDDEERTRQAVGVDLNGDGALRFSSAHHHRRHHLTAQQRPKQFPSSGSLLPVMERAEPDFSERASQLFQSPRPQRRMNTHLSYDEDRQPENSSSIARPKLAAAIHNYLQDPGRGTVWQTSADGRRLIGHAMLTRPPDTDEDFGLKVIGGRHTEGGQLGAIITKVRPRSMANLVGQLRPGDEVLEWNGNCFQNISHDAVCRVINASRNDSKLELIVARPTAAFTWAHRYPLTANASGISHSRSTGEWLMPTSAFHSSFDESTLAAPGHVSTAYIPHSQSMVAPLYSNSHYGTPATTAHRYPHLPGWIGLSQVVEAPYDGASAHICGYVEVSLRYNPAERELVATLVRAFDLTPRADGMPRNPYVKLFLLPDRSESSRRQTSVLAETLEPVWEESFAYDQLTEPVLLTRALELTLWDWDKYMTNAFLGEVLIDLSRAPLDGQVLLYTLVDLDEESPIRLRLRQRRSQSASSCYTPPPRRRALSQMGHYAGQDSNNYYYTMEGEGALGQYSTYYHPEGGYWPHPATEVHRRQRKQQIHDFSAQSGDWTKNTDKAGYLSDTNLAHGRHEAGSYMGGSEEPRKGRRPRSATAALRDATHALGEQEEAMKIGGMRQTRQEALRQHSGSDGSETLSVNSAQSMQNRAVARQRQQQRQQQQRYLGDQKMSAMESEDISMQGASADAARYQEHRGGHRGITHPLQQQLDGKAFLEEGVSGEEPLFDTYPPTGSERDDIPTIVATDAKDRKKTLMTRLISGRTGASDGARRTGFARSEEIGLHAPQAQISRTPNNCSQEKAAGGGLFPSPMVKQASKESTDSSDNWLPVHADTPLGHFTEGLGPGQVVGKHAPGIATAMGKLLLELQYEPQTGIMVTLFEAKCHLPREGAKPSAGGSPQLPVICVKAYLLEGRSIIAKAKTQPRTSNEAIRQTLLFPDHRPRGKMLQLTMLGDFGRMERRVFMGVAQINLDDETLDLQRGKAHGEWYKLFSSNSLNSSLISSASTAGAAGEADWSR